MDTLLILGGISAWLLCEYVGGTQLASPKTAFWLPKGGMLVAIVCISYGLARMVFG